MKLNDSGVRVGREKLFLERRRDPRRVADVTADVPAADDHGPIDEAADDVLGGRAEFAVLQHETEQRAAEPRTAPPIFAAAGGPARPAAPAGRRRDAQTAFQAPRVERVDAPPANSPFSVMYAEMPSTIITTTDSGCPPRPDQGLAAATRRRASSRCRTESRRRGATASATWAQYRSTWPSRSGRPPRAPVPSDRYGDSQHPHTHPPPVADITMSTTAPIVQKLARCATAPNTKARAKARPGDQYAAMDEAFAIAANYLMHARIPRARRLNPFRPGLTRFSVRAASSGPATTRTTDGRDSRQWRRASAALVRGWG